MYNLLVLIGMALQQRFGRGAAPRCSLAIWTLSKSGRTLDVSLIGQRPHGR